MDKAFTKYLTDSGLVCTGHGYLTGLLVGMDNVNDPQITVYDNTSASGKEIIPTTNLDASAKGFNGFFGGIRIEFSKGCYVLVEDPGGGAFSGSIELSIFISQSLD